MDKCSQLETCFDLVREDVDKFYRKGNKAAGTRARKSLQELKRLAQEMRADIMATAKNMKLESLAAAAALAASQGVSHGPPGAPPMLGPGVSAMREAGEGEGPATSAGVDGQPV